MSEVNHQRWESKNHSQRVPQNGLRHSPVLHQPGGPGQDWSTGGFCACVCLSVCVCACLSPCPRSQHYQLLDDPLDQGGEADVVAVAVVVHVLDQFGDALRVRL